VLVRTNTERSQAVFRFRKCTERARRVSSIDRGRLLTDDLLLPHGHVRLSRQPPVAPSRGRDAQTDGAVIG